MKRFSVQLAVDRAPEHVARLGVNVVAQQQPRAVADVLNRVREVVHETRRHAPEHRLPLLPLQVFLQLDEAICHDVERLTQIRELVAGRDVDARVQMASRGDVVRGALELEDRIDERAAERVADGNHREQRQRDRDDELLLQLLGAGECFVGRLLDHDGPAERRNLRRHSEVAAAVLVHVLARHRRVLSLLSSRGEHRVGRRHVARLRDERLLVRVAVRDQRAVRGDDHRVAVLAEADAVDHAPHLLEVELAGEPARGPVQAREMDAERRCGEEIFVDAHRRHQHAVDRQLRVLWNRDARLAHAARRDDRAALVEERDLPKFAELEDVVLEDAVLLPRLEAGVLQIGGERLEQVRVADDVAADFLGGTRGDVLVSGDDRFARAALERPDRDDAVCDKRDDCSKREQQREAMRDVPDSQGHSYDVAGNILVLISAGDPFVITRGPEPQCEEDITPGLRRRNGETLADGPCALLPGKENRRRVVDERLL